MQNYNSLDDAIIPEVEAKLPEEVKKEAKRFNPFYSPITNLGLVAALLFTGAVVAPRAGADGYDPKDKIGTEQMQSQIDLSQYTKVAEQDGLEFYLSNYTSSKPIHDLSKKTNPDWKTTPYRFYDCIIFNTSKTNYTIVEVVGKAEDRPGPVTPVNGETLKKIWGTILIPSNGYLIQKDRGAWSKKGIFPIKLSDHYKLSNPEGQIKEIIVEYSIK